MSLPSLGSALELPPVVETGDTTRIGSPVDLGAYQRAIMAQMQTDQGRLSQLEQERAALIARIHASRGKLDLIAELTRQVDPPRLDHNER